MFDRYLEIERCGLKPYNKAHPMTSIRKRQGDTIDAILISNELVKQLIEEQKKSNELLLELVATMSKKQNN